MSREVLITPSTFSYKTQVMNMIYIDVYIDVYLSLFRIHSEEEFSQNQKWWNALLLSVRGWWKYGGAFFFNFKKNEKLITLMIQLKILQDFNFLFYFFLCVFVNCSQVTTYSQWERKKKIKSLLYGVFNCVLFNIHLN